MEKIEDLQFAGLRFSQSDAAFRFGTDAVLLASFVEAKRGETVVDLGTGSGILPVLLSGRCEARFIGIELQAPAAELARPLMGWSAGFRFWKGILGPSAGSFRLSKW